MTQNPDEQNTDTTDATETDEELPEVERPSWAAELKSAGLEDEEVQMILARPVTEKVIRGVYRLGFEECIQRFSDLRINLTGFSFAQGLDRAAKALAKRAEVDYDVARVTAEVAILSFMNYEEHELDLDATASSRLPEDAEPVPTDPYSRRLAETGLSQTAQDADTPAPIPSADDVRDFDGAQVLRDNLDRINSGEPISQKEGQQMLRDLTLAIQQFGEQKAAQKTEQDQDILDEQD